MTNISDHKYKMPHVIPNIADQDLCQLSNLIQNPLSGYVYKKRFNMVLSLINNTPSNILEIGYGAGFLSYNIAPYADILIGIDIHSYGSQVKSCLKEMGVENFDFIQADARNLKMIRSETFDTIISVSCLEHIVECELVQEEMYRLLTPGGQAIYGLPIKNLLTKFLFKLIGYNDDLIHPSEPKDIINAAVSKGFTLENEKVFPYFCNPHTGLYWAGHFRK